jgi:hypothetical protein
MIQKAQTQAAVETKTASLLQRKCACGQHTIGGGQCDGCRKPKLTVGAADDHFEREADLTADAILTMTPGSRHTVTSLGSQIRREPGPGAESPDVDLQTEEEIQRLRGGGKRLGEPERRFFEPRFAMDFSAVRVHDGAAAATLARRVGAEAFTVGRDIFFSSERHDFTQPRGLHLLAHELTHVAQQTSVATDSLSVRRAKIPYRNITWADFKKAAPAGDPLEAVTASGFDLPNWRTSQSAAPTGKDCTIGRKADKEYKATASINPDIYDGIAPYMDQDQSWVKPRRKDGGKDYCAVTMPADCQQFFDQKNAEVKSQCSAAVGECRQTFKDGKTSYKVPINGVDIKVTSADDCEKKLAPECEKEMGKTLFYSLKDVQKNEYAKATSKAQCTEKTFQASCLAKEADDSTKLLKHEQGHFDISKKLAEMAKADLKARAAAFKAVETECGKSAAMKAAVAKASKFGEEQANRGGDWVTSKDKAMADYDDASIGTDHGKKDGEQKVWEGKIAAGLKEYDLNAPKAPAGGATPGTPTPTPGTNPTVPNPQTPTPKAQSSEDGGD